MINGKIRFCFGLWKGQIEKLVQSFTSIHYSFSSVTLKFLITLFIKTVKLSSCFKSSKLDKDQTLHLCFKYNKLY